jgi:hypothetical protein
MTAGAPDPGTVYLLHFDRPYGPGGGANGRGTARHYIGWTHDLAGRLAEHALGRGARLLEVVRDAGISWRLARTWEGGRDRERQLKNQGGASRCCPECGVKPRPPRQPHTATTQAVPQPAPVPGPEPQPPAYERGAARAQRAIHSQIATAFSATQIAEIHERITGALLPERLTTESREEAHGYSQTATALIQAHRAAQTTQPTTTAARAAQHQEEGTTVNTDPSPALQIRPATQWQKGALTAHQIITAQAAAGYSADRIAGKWDSALATYDHAKATPQEREWHQGASETAADMIQTLRDMERAEAEQAQTDRDQRQAARNEARPELEAEAG